MEEKPELKYGMHFLCDDEHRRDPKNLEKFRNVFEWLDKKNIEKATDLVAFLEKSYSDEISKYTATKLCLAYMCWLKREKD